MITPATGAMTIEWSRYADAWIVYAHSTNPDPGNPEGASLIYVGVCRFHQLGSWPDAQANSEWGKAMLAWPQNYLTVQLLAICDNEAEARNERMRVLSTLPRRPVCNERGYAQKGNGRATAIICNETGMHYQSAAEAARLLDVTAAMMSSHLNKRAGFDKVRGLTFRRKDDPL